MLGGLSGFYGGIADTIIQRVIEILRSIPTIPLWMGLAAALPREWSVLQVYFAITIIISLLGWTELARVVRGRFLAMREEDFVVSARLVGCSQMRTIFVHMVPSFMSHIIAATTLALPAMIISETALSFLGLGLRPPAISWGVLLQQAQNVQTVAISPWLMLPAVPVIIAVMAFNFLGDGLRDAADPYGADDSVATLTAGGMRGPGRAAGLACRRSRSGSARSGPPPRGAGRRTVGSWWLARRARERRRRLALMARPGPRIRRPSTVAARVISGGAMSERRRCCLCGI